VRNPMITGVALVVLGEGLVLGSVAILIEFAVFALANALWMPLVEEPGLARRFGDDYEEYRRAVRRWVPSREPWTPP
jgi:protein-S-isoprenylcysteine O-methyltransferase Ste14